MLDVETSCLKKAIPSLPLSIVQLTQLMCLRKNKWTRVPKGIGSLIALEELSGLCIDSKGKMVEELAHLTEL
jgi:branched-subunit amino acid transport protein AzlD